LINIRCYFSLFYVMAQVGSLDIGSRVTLDYFHNDVGG
jgi:hypothetical protein